MPITCSEASTLEDELEFMRLLRPMMTSPSTADEHPKTCLRYITMPSNNFEKMTVVMIAPPERSL